MRVLIIGSGAREHALAWKIAQSARVEKVFVAPGNGGTARDFENVPFSAGSAESAADFAEAQGIDLTVVGPEAPLVEGIRDSFDLRGLPLLGPSRLAARLEGSKAFSKDFMTRHGIPTARYRVVHSQAEGLEALDGGWEFPLVVKADGLAAGKGVLICASRPEAEAGLDQIFRQRKFGAAGDRAVLEEFLQGHEASYMVLTDGSAVAPLEPSQDYKRALDGDGGPNTGGMGAFSTPGLVHPDMAQRILESVIHPAIAGMAGEGCPFQGILYAGLMITGAGPRVLEFNVRLGDPETEVVLPRLESDLAMLLRAAAGGRLPAEPIRWSRRSAACVVLASGGYPGAYATGARISGLDGAALPEGVTVFHAGTRCADGALVTAGGRVLAVTATGGSVCEAAQTAYQAVEQIHFEGMHYRRDIGAEYRKQS